MLLEVDADTIDDLGIQIKKLHKARIFKEIAVFKTKMETGEDGYADGDGEFVRVSDEQIAKFCSSTQEFSYGGTKVFSKGLDLTSKDIQRSVEQECRSNDGRMYESEFEYVALEAALEREETDPSTGRVRIKDMGHDGWTLGTSIELPIAQKAGLKKVHVVVIRLYTGKLYAPWNRALRGVFAVSTSPSAKIALVKWATCIAVLYEAVIMLSHETEQIWPCFADLTNQAWFFRRASIRRTKKEWREGLRWPS
jgi:hypothetical protein